MRKIIVSLLLCFATQTALPRNLTVISVAGRCVVVENAERKPIRPGIELSDEDVISIPYNASLDLVDRQGSKQYHIKTPGRDRLSVFLANGKNGVSTVTKRFLDYIAEQMNGNVKRAARAHSDAATITRKVEKFGESASEEDEWDIDKWKQSLTEFTEDAENDFEEFRQKAIKEYEEFRAEANRQFAEFMADPWAEYKAEKAIPQPEEEDVEPMSIPKNEKGKLPAIESKPIKVDIDNIKVPEYPTPQPLPILPIVQDEEATVVDTIPLMTEDPAIDIVEEPVVKPDTEPVVEEKTTQPQPEPVGREILFFGTKVYVRYEPLIPFHIKSLAEKDIAEAWMTLSGDDFNNTIADCLTLRQQLRLSDWAYLQLLMQVSNTLLGKGSNEATLIMAYIYCQSGYKMRLSKTSDHLYMLYASRHKIYDVDYYELNGENYYPLNCDEDLLAICTLPYPEEQPLSLLLTEEPILANNQSPKRTLKNSNSPQMEATVHVNKNLIDFYNTYPTSEIGDNVMTRWAMYALTPIAKDVKAQIYPVLKEQLAGLSQYQAVGKLLAFVQYALTYEYDEKVWGHDRAFFAEETLYYDFADCEDRSILFSRLVRDLVGLKVALVHYPGHLGAAVAFTEQVTGDYIPVGDERFVICDPTYIGAPIGCTMPCVRGTAVEVFILN